MGRGALFPTPCRSFAPNAVRLQLHALAYNLGTFLRTLALPEGMERWSLTTLRERLIKIGAKVVSHGRYVTFQPGFPRMDRRSVGVVRRFWQPFQSLTVNQRAEHVGHDG